MINWDVSPILFQLGPIQIRYYALVYVLGFIVTLVILLKAIRKNEINMTEEQVYDLVFYSIIGVIVGARIFHVLFWGLSSYLEHPLRIFFIWEGGLSFHGGLLGSVVVFILYSKLKKINLWKLADLVIVPTTLFLALGRIGNFINGELWGIMTNVPWCVNFKGAEGCRHPIQLYAAFGRFVLFLFLWKIKKCKDGFFFWVFVFLMGIGRLFLDFLREDVRYFGLAAGQWLSIMMILIGGYFLLKKHKQDLKLLFNFSKKQAGNNQDNTDQESVN